MRFKLFFNVVVAAALFWSVRHAAAQQTAAWQPTGSDNWNIDANWFFPGGGMVVPDAAFDDSAEITNGGTAVIDSSVPDIVNLNVTSGVVDVQNNGSLSMVRPFDTGGNLTVGAGGTVQLSGNASLTTEFNATNNGLVTITGSGATLDVGGDFSGGGVYAPEITGNTHTVIDVTGHAQLGGTLRPSFNGVSPAFGDSWQLFSAGSISGNFGTVDQSNAGALPLGLRLRSRVDGNQAFLDVDNQLVMTIDRLTGTTTVENLAGGPINIKGYTIGSQNNLLDPDGWSSLEDAAAVGWREANPSATFLSELNLENQMTFDAGSAVEFGAAYTPGPQSSAMEDVFFEYITDTGEIVNGLVQYEGPVNDLLLRVNPETGEAVMGSLSPFFEADVKGYSILSASGALTPDSWESLADSGAENWREANPNTNGLSELNLLSSRLFAGVDIVPLGSIFQSGGMQDLAIEYIDSDGNVRLGVVEYGELPDIGDGLPADFNMDGMVDLTDFNILKANFGSTMASSAEGDANMDGGVDLTDFNILKASFGQSGAAVPEPATVVLALLGFSVLTWRRVHRDGFRSSR